MKSLLAFTVPGDARAKVRHAKFKPHRTVVYENWVRECALAAMQMWKGGTWEPLDCPLRLDLVVTVRPPKRAKRTHPTTRPDLSNVVKQIEDSMTLAGVWADDDRVVEIHARKVYGEPGVEVVVYGFQP